MSYSFNMGFKEVPKEKALETALEFVTMLTEKETAKEYVTQNKMYFPPNRFNMQKDKNVYKWVDIWVYLLFNIQFVYFNKQQILGICGYYPNECKKLFDTWIYFQNSTEQDYDYKNWDGISYFEEMTNQVKEMSLNQIQENYDYDITEGICGLEYYKKSLLYNKIYKELELDSWLYDNPGNFMRFALNGIASSEKQLDLYRITSMALDIEL